MALASAALALGCGNDATDDGLGTKQEAVLPPGFQAESLISGLDQPTALRFAPNGRIFVAEKQGTILSYAGFGSSAVAVADLRTEVYDYWDRGLLDIEVHPEFPSQPYIFALYTLDGRVGESLGAGVPRYNDNCSDPGLSCPCAGRLDRIEVNPATGTLVSKTTLVENWGQQFPSHSIGSLKWGPDGFLYVSGGDGASFNGVDYGNLAGNPLGDPPNASGALTPPTAMGGALRSQVITPPAATPPFPTWFDGKVLRIDPDTMTPMLDPKAVTAPPPIVASGLRNPFRMTFRPGSSELWIGDVGWGTWEEINRIQDVTAATSAPVNFGWPCYEGAPRQGGYQAANLTICNNLYAAATAVSPHFQYFHSGSLVAGDGCEAGGSSITGLAFYSGTSYPAQYQGALFFSDYSRRCTWYLPAGPGGVPNASSPQRFASGAGAPVQLVMGPDGDLYYVNIEGSIGRFHFSTANHVPQAVMSANPTTGPAPLTVNFSAAGSNDSDAGDTLTYSWDLNGDGVFGDATTVNTSYVYTSTQVVTARLRVTDNHGASGTATTVINPGQNAPTPTIELLSAANWRAGEPIVLAGSASDDEDGELDETALEWTLVLQHCTEASVCHAHVIEELAGLDQIEVLGPDHEYPSHLEVTLTATDSDGLVSSTTLRLDPLTAVVNLTSDPPGLQLALNQAAGPAPRTATVIRNATTTVSAPDQTVNGTQYTFVGWSDGGAATHALNPNAATVNLIATFQSDGGGEEYLSASGTPIALITAPMGGGNKNLDIIKDGVKPPVGSTDSNLQYDTYNGAGTRPNDWLGYSFASNKQFTRVVFQEGKNFWDGGAFSGLTVQVRNGGVWTNVTGLSITPTYPGNNGVSYETFTLTFTPTSGDGIRIYGAPVGVSQFVSVAELEVYGSHQAGPPANAPPTASAGADKSVNIGSAVTVSGSGSDPEGSAITYQWTQTAGPAVTLSGATTATLSFTAPATPTSLTFQLVTNDGALSSLPDTVDVTVVDPATVNLAATGTPIALITAPSGGGNKNLNIIKDGVKPPVGSADINQQYDTYNGGGPRPEDWIGYSFTGQKQFTRVVFQEGRNFWDGGAFTSLNVQVRNGGVWTNVTGLNSAPTYPGLNTTNFETFTLTFNAAVGDAIRVQGAPAGSSRFISIAELEVYGTDQSGPPPNQPPTANAGADSTVSVGTAVSLVGSGSDPEGASITYQWTQTGGTSVTLTGANTATPSFTAPAAATTLTFQLVTHDGALGSTPDAVSVVVTAAPINAPPSANAGPDQSVNVGAAVTLAGSGSDPEGAAISYLWAQIGGPVVTLNGAANATASFTAPGGATTLTFQLTTNDGTTSSTPDVVVVTVNDPSTVNLAASGTPIALITAPTGGGNKNLNIIKDGVKPAAGSTNYTQQYDTYAGGTARPNDWIGYSFASSKTFTRVVFQEGGNFHDGGAFTSLTVQVRSGGVWTNVSGLNSTPAYPGNNGVSFESFTLTFNPVSGDGIRVYGPPAGWSQFVSIAELEVYGSDQGGPPPNAPPTASAGPDQNVNAGAPVSLSGSGSDPEGAPISYAWTQIGGAVVTLTGATTATPSFTAPAVETTLTFQLTTSDGTQSSAADTVNVVVVDPLNVNLAASGTPIALITAPSGGGNKNLNVIKDGIKPAAGSSVEAINQQYDTYNGGGARPSDWIGYSFAATRQFNRVVFQEGLNFWDGGAFADLTVQVRNGGVWTNVTGLAFNPAYTALNGASFETFSITFNSASGDAIRIIGTPAGSARFISVAELEVYGQ